MRSFSLHVTAVAVVTVLLLAGAAGAQEDTTRQIVSVEFPGGTVAEYIRTIRQAAPDANIVMTPDAEFVRLEPVNLTQVDIEAAIFLLNNLEAHLPDRFIRLDVDSINSGHGNPVLIITAEAKAHRRPAGAPEMIQSGVWSVANVLERGLDPEHVATAIETSLELFGDEYPPASVRFHAESGLVLARGHVDQISAIENVVSALSVYRPHDGMEAQFRMERAQVHKLAAHAAGLEDQIQVMTREMTEWQTRAEMYSKQLEDAMREAQVATAQRNDVMAQFEREVARLQMELDAARGDGED